MTDDYRVQLREVAKSFGSRRVLQGVSLEVPAGSVYVLCGPSGAGKTTLLRLLNRLDRADAGEIRVGRHAVTGRPDLRALRREVALVFQSGALYPHRTVLDNLTLAPRKALGWSRAEADAAAQVCLARFGLADRAGDWPHQLSGGEQRRVAIARALVGRPAVLLLDEPTASLDPAAVRGVHEAVRAAIGGGTTTLIVTHDLSFAAEIADRIGLLDSGRLHYDGAPAGFFASTDPVIQSFREGQQPVAESGGDALPAGYPIGHGRQVGTPGQVAGRPRRRSEAPA